MNIKVIEKKGLKPGKNVVILAGIHGNEVCGVKAFDRIIPEIKIESGSVIFIYANLEAIRQNKRFVEANLNRCFFKEQPIELKETLEGKTAREIMPYLEKADIMLDIHASFTKESIPFVICDESKIKDALIFDSEIVVCNIDPFHPGSTDYFMNIQNKPGFGFECGYLGDLETQKIAEKAILSFLIYNKSINGEIRLKENQRYIKITNLYRNTERIFVKSRDFKDFERLKERTLIGKDGEKEVYADAGKILLFVRDQDILNDECFLTAEEIA